MNKIVIINRDNKSKAEYGARLNEILKRYEKVHGKKFKIVPIDDDCAILAVDREGDNKPTP